MARKKIALIGGGQIGGVLAQLCALRELGDVVMFDIVEGLPQGKMLDIAEVGPVDGFDVNLKGTNSYEDIQGSDIVIVTAGLPRKPGMSRDDLLKANAEIVGDATRNAVKQSPNAILIVVTNPLDAMCEVARRTSGFPRERVLGMAGVLDSARFSTFIAQELRVSVDNVHASVLGGHGDQMVPLPRYSTVAGVPITELMDAATIERLVSRTATGGAEIVNLLKAGSAYYAPARSIAEMVDAILNDRHKILPCAVYLQGEYGLANLFIGVPCKLHSKGLEAVIELKLTPEEQAALRKSAEAVKGLVDALPQPAAAG